MNVRVLVRVDVGYKEREGKGRGKARKSERMMRSDGEVRRKGAERERQTCRLTDTIDIAII